MLVSTLPTESSLRLLYIIYLYPSVYLSACLSIYLSILHVSKYLSITYLSLNHLFTFYSSLFSEELSDLDSLEKCLIFCNPFFFIVLPNFTLRFLCQVSFYGKVVKFEVEYYS